jgi:hypothetical protein
VRSPLKRGEWNTVARVPFAVWPFCGTLDLHMVVSYSELPITIITVYEPRPPKWRTPTERGGDE